jgi:hypothetical protein
MTYRLALLTALMVSLFPTLSHSAIITLDFTGKVTDIFDPENWIGDQIALGAPVEASIRYDTLWPDSSPSPNSGEYDMPGGLKVTIGGLLFEQTGIYHMSVTHGSAPFPESFFHVYTSGTSVFGDQIPVWPASLPQFDFSGFDIQFSDTQAPFDLLSSDAPPASFDITRADGGGGFGLVVAHRISSPDVPAYRIQFELTQQAEIVPEPGTLSLLAFGLVTGATLRRRLL